MSELFKSAYEYFSGPTNGQSDNDFVGQIIEISNVKLRIKKVIAEGGFAVVYVAQDVATGVDYALKRLLAADEEAKANVIQEINILKKLSGHSNVIQYLSTLFIDKSQTSHGQFEFLLVTELCTGGSLVEILQARAAPFDVGTITRIVYQTCKALAHMHAQGPPIVHRDLKIENLLLGKDGAVKLCDFGSATTNIYRPDLTWSANQHSSLEENMARFTTPMYRAPEMVDTWNNEFIGPPVDIWALGCILYTFCFMRHPFEDSAKLRIINANYNLPPDPRYTCFHDIIRGCLQVSPNQRLTVSGVLDRLAAIAESNAINVRAPLKFAPPPPPPPAKAETAGNGDGPHNGVRPPPPRPAPPRPAASVGAMPPPVSAPAAPAASGLFSSIKGGAGSFFKGLKDTSSKVMATVQQSIARTDLDISYITSRIIVMPYPSEGIESAYRTNHIDDVRLFLDTRHAKYTVYNLSGKSYQSKFGANRIVDCGFAYPDQFRAPLLNALYQLCEAIYQGLAGDSRSAAVVHCTDGRAASATLVCALAVYARLVEVPEDALQMFAVKRCPPHMRAGELRYLYYLAGIVQGPAHHPHYKPVTLVSVQMAPVPLFTKVRDGCRPYVEVYSENRCVLSTLQDYERMRLFNVAEGKVILPISTTVCGDVCIIIYHARNVFGGVMTQGKATGIKICQIQFHTGFIPEEETTLKYTKSDLDELSENQEHYQDRFAVNLAVFVSDSERKPSQPPPWMTDQTKRTADTLFTTKLERDETIDNFVSRPKARPAAEPPARPPPPPAPTPLDHSSGDSDGDSQPEPALVEAVDLLNLNAEPAGGRGATRHSPSSNFDLLSGFGDVPASEAGGADLFDPFGGADWGFGGASAQGEPKGDLFGSLGPGTWAGSGTASPSRAPPTTPQHVPVSGGSTPQRRGAQSPPDYSRSHFDTVGGGGGGGNAPANNASKPKSDDVFGDLLGSQGYTFTAKKDVGPKTINAMRKGEMASYMDPDKIKVLDWTEGKKNNIRALLCSMHTILWEGAKWNKCDMHQLVSAADVKKAYRRACLAVHPDKQAGTDNEDFAKLIFMELNNAWSDFENDASQQNMFS